MPQPPLRPLVALLALAAALPALAEEDVAVLSMEELSEAEVRFVSGAGEEVLGHIRSARAALADRDRLRARSHVAKARRALRDVRRLSPPARIQDRIARAIEAISDSEEARPESLLPIYVELDAVQDASAVAEVRGHVDAAQAHVEAGRTDLAVATLTEASATLVYLEIDLPVEATYHRLGHAQVALASRETPGAEAALREAETHVETFVAIAKAHYDATNVAAEPPD